jgi:hypothetical protein
MTRHPAITIPPFVRRTSDRVVPLRPAADPAPHPAPPMGPARALFVRAMFALIDRVLEDRTDLLPGEAARRFIAGAVEADAGEVTSTADTLRFTLLGITASVATTTGSTDAVLREWQREAGLRLARELRP